METESEKEFRIPLISTSELEARSVSCTEESNGETSLPALTNELLHAQHTQCTEIAEGQETLTSLKVIYLLTLSPAHVTHNNLMVTETANFWLANLCYHSYLQH